MIYVKSFAIIALVISSIWCIKEPKFDSFLALATSISGVVTSFLVDKRNTRKRQQSQSVSSSSIGVQAGRDINIEKIHNDHHAK
jgi:hypothetical protein